MTLTRRAPALLLCSFLMALPAGTTWAKSPDKSGKPATPSAASPEIAEKQQDLGEIRQRIEGLKKELNTSEENQANAADRLRESERQISRLQRELHDLSEQRSLVHKKLLALDKQSQELETTLSQQQGQLEKLLYRQYLRGTPDALQLFLNGDDPNQLARDMHYLSAVAQSRADLMDDIQRNLARKKTLAGEAKAKAEQLADIETQQQQRHAELEKQRQERQRLHTQISDKVKAQKKEIGSLQQNEKRLTQLIDRLARTIAAQTAAAAAAARAKPRPPSEPTPGKSIPDEPKRPKTVEADNAYEPVPGGNFTRQKGSLRLPVRGAVSGHFGSPREGGGTWKGVFIRAGQGNEVKSVANGRVVFADWMRGFGNLLIVDHGDAYLSIYGNNEALLKTVGQSVKGGEAIATVGNSGGNPDSGLYFEIRHQGQPIDPMKWASLK